MRSRTGATSVCSSLSLGRGNALTVCSGCRKEKADFLYKDEWEEYAKELDGKVRHPVRAAR